MSDSKPCTAAELARIYKVSRMTVSRHVKSGWIKPVSATASGKPLYDPEQARSAPGLAWLNNRNYWKAY